MVRCVRACGSTHFIRAVAVIYTLGKKKPLQYTSSTLRPSATITHFRKHFSGDPSNRAWTNFSPLGTQGRPYSMGKMSRFDALSAFFIVVSTLVGSNPTCARAESLFVHLAVTLGSWHVAQTRPRETRRAVCESGASILEMEIFFESWTRDLMEIKLSSIELENRRLFSSGFGISRLAAQPAQRSFVARQAFGYFRPFSSILARLRACVSKYTSRIPTAYIQKSPLTRRALRLPGRSGIFEIPLNIAQFSRFSCILITQTFH